MSPASSQPCIISCSNSMPLTGSTRTVRVQFSTSPASTVEITPYNSTFPPWASPGTARSLIGESPGSDRGGWSYTVSSPSPCHAIPEWQLVNVSPTYSPLVASTVVASPTCAPTGPCSSVVVQQLARSPQAIQWQSAAASPPHMQCQSVALLQPPNPPHVQLQHAGYPPVGPVYVRRL